MPSNRSIGAYGEQKAVDHIRSLGFTLLERNVHFPFGEIDIIATKDRTLYFLEVKTRTSLSAGKPYEAIDRRKLSHLRKAAEAYVLKKGYGAYKLSLQAVSVIAASEDTVQINMYEIPCY